MHLCGSACIGEVPSAGTEPDEIKGPKSSGGSAGSGGSGGTATGTKNPLQPGATASLRRLTPLEYANTVRDLLGSDVRPRLRAFPSDGRTEGFDNNSASLGLSTTQLELFAETADYLATQALLPGSAARAKYFACSDLGDAQCQGSILGRFASRAFRRPLVSGELEKLLALVKSAAAAGAQPQAQMQLAFRAVLTSPQFLFRVEAVPAPAQKTPYPVTAHELASRLSYFLWSSMPDDKLTELAANGDLLRPATLAEQVNRMLSDPKSLALTENFATQWFGINELENHQVDKMQFGSFDPELSALMAAETTTLFKHILDAKRPLSELLSADYSFAAPKLLTLYGLPNAGSSGQRTDISALPRRGLLGQASILTITSYPNRTSVVRRGIWVLEKLMCTFPPPPPPDISTELGAAVQGTLRQRMVKHRENPSCASCHNLIDPVGFGLENFDPIGRHRTLDNGQPIDASGSLNEGGKFSGPKQLSELLATDERFTDCVVAKLLTFALGRTVTAADDETIQSVVKSSGVTPSLWSLVDKVARSEALTTRVVKP